MPSLIGNKPNQVSTNGDLGTLAFQDANAVNITGGIVDVSAGTAALPTLGTTGDPDTGVFFPAANTVAASTNGTERMRIPAAGGVQAVTCVSVGNATPAASGAGITFPATQSASSDANTLDDYEEGTWTPGVDFSGNNVGMVVTTTGNYTKVGRLVTIRCTVTFSAKGSSTGYFVIRNLPFTVATKGAGTCGYNFAIVTNGYTMFSFTALGTNIFMHPLGYGDAANHTFFADGTDIQDITITYFV